MGIPPSWLPLRNVGCETVVGGVTVLGGSAGRHIHSDEQGTQVSEDFRWM